MFLAVELSNHSNSKFYCLHFFISIVQCKHPLNLENLLENVSRLCETQCHNYVFLRKKIIILRISKNYTHCAYTKIVVNESELRGIAQPLIN